MNSKFSPPRKRTWWSVGTAGAATVELAVATPVLLTLVLGGADYGHLLATTQSLAAATRVGAQVARNDSACQSSATGASVLNPPPNYVLDPCRNKVYAAMQNSRHFSPALTPYTVKLVCYCVPSGGGTPAPTRDTSPPGGCRDPANSTQAYLCSSHEGGLNAPFILVTATQTVPAPMFPWPGYPSTLTGMTELRLQ